MMLASICPWVFTMPALKSSAVDSMPSIVEGFIDGSFGKFLRLRGSFRDGTRRFLFLDCTNIGLNR